jgi:CrcB protein
MARYLLSGWIQRGADGVFPVGTLAVNVIGSLLLGFLLRYSLEGPSLSVEMRTLLTIGFCGGFTTFSTFSYETVALIQSGQWTRAGLYALSSLVLTVGATFAGLILAQSILQHGHQA